eukprot:356742-Chlamydomonas_euryale.AAC.4
MARRQPGSRDRRGEAPPPQPLSPPLLPSARRMRITLDHRVPARHPRPMRHTLRPSATPNLPVRSANEKTRKTGMSWWL